MPARASGVPTCSTQNHILFTHTSEIHMFLEMHDPFSKPHTALRLQAGCLTWRDEKNALRVITTHPYLDNLLETMIEDESIYNDDEY